MNRLMFGFLGLDGRETAVAMETAGGQWWGSSHPTARRLSRRALELAAAVSAHNFQSGK